MARSDNIWTKKRCSGAREKRRGGGGLRGGGGGIRGGGGGREREKRVGEVNSQ